MESPEGLGPMMPEYNGKPAEGLARLRQAKTGAVPALFHHKKYGDIGIMYGKPGNPELRDACSLKQGQFRQYLYQARDFI